MLPVCGCTAPMHAFRLQPQPQSQYAVASCAEADKQYTTQSRTTLTQSLKTLFLCPAGTPLLLCGATSSICCSPQPPATGR